MLSIPHMIVVFVVVLVLFGPQKLPELARGLGKLMAEFRKASLDFKTAFEEEMRDLERQALQAERKKAAEAASAAAEPVHLAAVAPSVGRETTSNEASADAGASGAQVTSPAAESIPRSADAPAEATQTTGLQESHHDVQRPA
jgi:sec-independent protein translocase protein TatB